MVKNQLLKKIVYDAFDIIKEKEGKKSFRSF